MGLKLGIVVSMIAQKIIPPVFFFLVCLGLSYLVAKRTNDSVVSWIAIGVSAAIISVFAILFSGDLYRDVGGRDINLVFLLARFYQWMADGVAALLAGGIAGTLLGMFRKAR